MRSRRRILSSKLSRPALWFALTTTLSCSSTKACASMPPTRASTTCIAGRPFRDFSLRREPVSLRRDRPDDSRTLAARESTSSTFSLALPGSLKPARGGGGSFASVCSITRFKHASGSPRVSTRFVRFSDSPPDILELFSWSPEQIASTAVPYSPAAVLSSASAISLGDNPSVAARNRSSLLRTSSPSSGRRGLLMTCPPPPSRGSQQFCPKLVVSRP